MALGQWSIHVSAADTQMIEYRKLGCTDLRVSILGFGSVPLGKLYGITEP